jgi:regulator of sigma E protease
MPAVLGQVTPDGPAAAAGLREGDRGARHREASRAPTFPRWYEASSRRTAGCASSLVATARRGRASALASMTEVRSRRAAGRTHPRRDATSAARYAGGHDRAQHLRAGAGAAAGDRALLGDDGAAGAPVLAHADGAGVHEEPVSGPLRSPSTPASRPARGLAAVPRLPRAHLPEPRLPQPAADSDPRRGQVVYQLAEWVKGSPLSDRAQAFGQQVGIALLLLLMGVALFNDVARQFGLIDSTGVARASIHYRCVVRFRRACGPGAPLPADAQVLAPPAAPAPEPSSASATSGSRACSASPRARSTTTCPSTSATA